MQEFTKTDFKNMEREAFYIWVYEHKEQLIGSAIFTRNNKFGSKLVSWVQKIHDKAKDDFVPSHTASIIEKDGQLYLFDMKPPKASIQPLTRYLLATDDDYVLMLRNFPLDTFMFSQNMIYHIGEFYAYLSALRSVLTKRDTKFVNHCSELHFRELQKQGLYPNINPEITPNELLTLFRKPKFKNLDKFVESDN
jgi:hypothetical protein